jgi:hypothetical protein
VRERERERERERGILLRFQVIERVYGQRFLQILRHQWLLKVLDSVFASTLVSFLSFSFYFFCFSVVFLLTICLVAEKTE